MVAIRGTGTAHSSGAPVFIPSFKGVLVAQSSVFCVLFCRLLFVLFCIYQTCQYVQTHRAAVSSRVVDIMSRLDCQIMILKA